MKYEKEKLKRSRLLERFRKKTKVIVRIMSQIRSSHLFNHVVMRVSCVRVVDYWSNADRPSSCLCRLLRMAYQEPEAGALLFTFAQ